MVDRIEDADDGHVELFRVDEFCEFSFPVEYGHDVNHGRLVRTP